MRRGGEELGESRTLKPSEIRFTHNKISPAFRTGQLIDRELMNLKKGLSSFSDFPKLTVTEFEGRLYSINNRRLFVARVLEFERKLETITVKVFPFAASVIQNKKDGLSKWDRSYSTTNQGLTVQVHSAHESKQLPQFAPSAGPRVPGAPPPVDALVRKAGGAPAPAAAVVAEGASTQAAALATAAAPKTSPPPQARPTLYTVGYSRRSLGDLLAIARLKGIGGFIDVRENPWSMRAELCKEEFGRWCNENGISYWWVGNDIGGKTKRDVEARLRTADGRATLEDIYYQVGGDVVWAVLCLEAQWKECEPRIMLSEQMSKRNVHVEHIGPECCARGGGDRKGNAKGYGKGSPLAGKGAASGSFGARGKGNDNGKAANCKGAADGKGAANGKGQPNAEEGGSGKGGAGGVGGKGAAAPTAARAAIAQTEAHEPPRHPERPRPQVPSSLAESPAAEEQWPSLGTATSAGAGRNRRSNASMPTAIAAS